MDVQVSVILVFKKNGGTETFVEGRKHILHLFGEFKFFLLPYGNRFTLPLSPAARVIFNKI